MMERVGAQTQLKLTQSPFLLMQGFNIDYTCNVYPSKHFCTFFFMRIADPP